MTKTESFDDNPEWTDADFARARPAAEFLTPARMDNFKRTRGPQKSRPVKKQVTLRLDPDVIDHFKSAGPGWQSRVNEKLREALKG